MYWLSVKNFEVIKLSWPTLKYSWTLSPKPILDSCKCQQFAFRPTLSHTLVEVLVSSWIFLSCCSICILWLIKCPLPTMQKSLKNSQCKAYSVPKFSNNWKNIIVLLTPINLWWQRQKVSPHWFRHSKAYKTPLHNTSWANICKINCQRVFKIIISTPLLFSNFHSYKWQPAF